MNKKLISKLMLAAALVAPTIASAFVLGPTSPGKWGSPTMGTGATITWSLTGTINCAADTNPDENCVALSTFMPVGFESRVQAAFDAWSAVANLTFIQVVDNGVASNATGTNADIRLSGHTFDGPSGTLAHGYFPPNNGVTIAGDIHFDMEEVWKNSFGGPGIDIFQVLTHELGHALGLEHTQVEDSLMNPFYTEAFSGPQADDIAGMRFIYGAPVVNETPEPSSWALVGLAALCLGLRRRAL